MKIVSGEIIFPWLGSLTVSGILIFSHNQVLAQVTPDNTLGDESSVVNSRDATSESIDGGAVRGENLFHSFEEFNVGEDRGVYFANPDAVTNIFSRVTGENVSNILGTLGVDGAANLYLINPNGIVFGEGASLDVQGSFTATTADGIEFGEQGFFSTVNPESPPLLTINPSAYLFNQVAPGAIANNSKAAADFNPATSFDDGFYGLRVPDGQSLLLLGGDLKTDGGGLVASGGRIDLGAIAGEGVVGLNANGSLNIPDSISRGDVSLTNGAGFLVAGDGGGDLAIAAKDISLDSGSGISAGIYSNLDSPNAQAGDLIINATDNITVDNSRVANEVYLETAGNAGDIFINADSLQVLNGSQIGSPTFGRGDGGNVTVRASNIELAGTSSDEQLTSGLFTTVESQAQGNGGNLTINTDNLSLSDRAEISASTFGEGDAGNVKINVTNNIALDNESTISSNIEQGALGNGGQIEIDTNTLDLTNGGQVLTIVREARNNLPAGKGEAGDIAISVNGILTLNGRSEDGQSSSAIYSDLNTGAKGKAGNLEIDAKNLVVQDGGQISSSTFGQGNAGDIIIQATDSVTFDGVDSNDNYSGSASNVGAGGVGNGGNLNITARSLSLTNGGYLSTSVREAFETLPGGRGQGGNINIDVDDTVTIADGDRPGIFASLGTGAVGSGGNIDIQAGNLIIRDSGQLEASTFGQGNAGDIIIQATDSVTFNGFNGNNYSSAFSNVGAGGQGDGGEINITAGSLSLTNGGQLTASVSGASDSLPGGNGQGGNINIDVDNTLTIADGNIPGIFANLGADAVGSAGNVDIQAGNLVVKDGGQISSSTFGQGNAGDITIQAINTVTFDGFDSNNNYSSAFSTVEAGSVGNGGKINITAGSLSLTNGGQLTASVRGASDSLQGGKGQGGNINIDVDYTLTISGENTNGIFANLGTDAVGNAGNIGIQAGNLVVKDGGQINSFTSGKGDAGNIVINVDDTLTLDGTSEDGQFLSAIDSFLNTGAEGQAGNIKIDTKNLVIQDGGEISSSTFGQGNAGNVVIKATDNIALDNVSTISSNIEQGAVGNGGQIEIDANTLDLTNGGQVLTIVREARNNLPAGKGEAGDIAINVDDTLTLDGTSEDGQFSSAIYSDLNTGAEGNAGNLEIDAKNLVVQDSGLISSSTLGQGNAGNILIKADNSISLDASSYIVNNVQDINAIGDAGKIDITTGSLSVTNGSQINSFTRGQGNAGNITIQAIDAVTFDGFDREGLPSSLNTIVEDGAVGDGGNISLTAGNIRLRNDSEISTYVSNDTGDGGNISVTADSVIAFDDSDIFAFAADGKGGNINLDTPAFFAENFTLNSLTADPETLYNNSRADVNATGAVSGSVSIPDVNSIQNSLNNLPGNSINTDELVANSCVVPVGNRKKGKFVITGTESLPVRPGDGIPSKYPTGKVRNVPENNHSSWQSGDPIVEPQGAYRLANGKLVLSRECSR